MRCFLRYFWAVFAFSSILYAEGPPFDLYGPKIDVHVKRGDLTLPISETANLLPGDRLWIHPDLPESQATHFVLVVAFLRGSTNPPPAEWFTRVETWTRAAHDEGVFVKVPAEAEQALLFLAPETGGDFNTLRNAVRGRPGLFVRAAQDLEAASWERMRLEAYLDGVKVTSQFDPAALKSRTEMAARSLGIKLNENCFSRPADQQATCLAQNSEGMVLDDANAQSLVNQLTSGSALDLMNAISSTTMAGGGAYSPYVGAIVDTVKILSSLHTAHFQYIPALALPTGDSLNLRLNMPPSFVNPKSVVVVALPPIGPSLPEPLHPVNPSDSFCAMKPDLVLAATGAPLVFATGLAHDLVLHIESSGAKHSGLDLPLTAEPGKGGLVPAQPIAGLPSGELMARVRGKWGFDDWEGPSYQLVAAAPGGWRIAAADQSALVVGRDDTLHIEGPSTVCVQKVEAQTSGSTLPLEWKSPKAGTLEVKVPLKDATPGPVTLAVYQFGLAAPDHLAMEAYDAAASLEGLTLSAGDESAVLRGTRLDQVANAQVEEIAFKPGTLNRAGNLDELQMTSAGSTASLIPGKEYLAHVELKDGRVLTAPVKVGPPRPQVMLLNKGVESGGMENDAAAPQRVALASPDDLPVDGRLVFFLKSVVPEEFPRDEKVEVAAGDSSFHTTLSLTDGSLMLEDARTAVGSLEPLKRFGASAFGPVRVRAIAADGAASDWVQLGTLVRLPGFTALRCPRSMAKPCLLSGTNLFLALSVAATQDFSDAVEVPQFTGTQVVVPHPVNGVLYVKLRDDPATVQTLSLPVTSIPAAMLPAGPAKEPIAATTPPALPAAPADPPSAPADAPAISSPEQNGRGTQPPSPKP